MGASFVPSRKATFVAAIHSAFHANLLGFTLGESTSTDTFQISRISFAHLRTSAFLSFPFSLTPQIRQSVSSNRVCSSMYLREIKMKKIPVNTKERRSTQALRQQRFVYTRKASYSKAPYIKSTLLTLVKFCTMKLLNNTRTSKK